VTGLPVCSDCAKGLIQVGVQQVIMPKQDDTPENWMKSFELTKQLFEEAGVAWQFI
jgi:dCMP deaminase